jgi:hypothetical protein
METQNIINIVLVALCVFAIGLAVFGMGKATVTGAQSFFIDSTFAESGVTPVVAGDISMGTGTPIANYIALGGWSFDSLLAVSSNINFVGGTFSDGVSGTHTAVANIGDNVYCVAYTSFAPGAYLTGDIPTLSLNWITEADAVSAGAPGLVTSVPADIGQSVDPANWVTQVVLVDALADRDFLIAGDLNIAPVNYGLARTIDGYLTAGPHTTPYNKVLAMTVGLKFTAGPCL